MSSSCSYAELMFASIEWLWLKGKVCFTESPALVTVPTSRLSLSLLYCRFSKPPFGIWNIGIFRCANSENSSAVISLATAYEEAAQLSKGAYIVVDAAKPAVVMLASGSEVATLVEGAELLSKEGIAVRIVSVPSEGLFRDQPKSYQQTVLPQGVVRYGLTSGLPVTLLGLVGENGMIHGLDHFGYSAPYKVLDEKFGYNGQTVYEEVKKLIGK